MGEGAGSFREGLTSVERGLIAIYRGDHEPFHAVWSQAADVSIFGAMGSCTIGWAEVRRVLPAVAARYRDGTVRFHYEVVHEGVDIGYAVGFERGDASIDGQPRSPTTIRFTHVLRREGGQWRLVHRHGDFLVGPT